MSNKPYKANTIANYFLQLADSSGEFVSPMKLQKLIYFAHGWHLAIRKNPLLDEDIQAWQYGPVIPSVYHEFKEFGGDAITRKAETYEEDRLNSDIFTIALLNKVWNVYSHLSAMDLSRITHLPKSPWSLAKSSNKTDTAISDDVIRSHFENELKIDKLKNEQCS